VGCWCARQPKSLRTPQRAAIIRRTNTPQIARVRAPWVRQCVFGHWGDETTYIIPNREWVVVGGTGQVGDWRTTADLGDAEAMMQRACQVGVGLRDLGGAGGALGGFCGLSVGGSWRALWRTDAWQTHACVVD